MPERYRDQGRMTRRSAATLVLAAVCLAGCGSSRDTRAEPAGAARLVSWTAHTHVRGVVDLSAPQKGRSTVVAAAGKLALLLADGRVRPFARRYSAPPGLEPYIALSSAQRVPAAGCRFPVDAVYALRLNHGDGVTVIDRRGAVRRFARLPSRGLENGIAFDGTGRFGHRLLVTVIVSGKTTVDAIDCRGHVQVLTRDGPRAEGGMVVAPSTFGRFGGDLIVPDELSGTIYAITPDGHSRPVAQSGLPSGQDIGVESEGFVPARFQDALVADRRTRRNRHPGDDLVLGLSRASLAVAGVHPGDLLAVAEGGAGTIAVTCTTSCRVRHVADGPRIAHVEGHVVFSAQ
jgi:hypothetical protein